MFQPNYRPLINPFLQDGKNVRLKNEQAVITKEIELDSTFQLWYTAKKSKLTLLQAESITHAFKSNVLWVSNKLNLKYHLFFIGHLLENNLISLNKIRVLDVSNNPWLSNISGLNMKILSLPSSEIYNADKTLTLLLYSKDNTNLGTLMDLLMAPFANLRFYQLIRNLLSPQMISVSISKDYTLDTLKDLDPILMADLIKSRLNYFKEKKEKKTVYRHINLLSEVAAQNTNQRDLINEIHGLSKAHLIVQHQHIKVYIAKANEIPYVLNEIGVQRERTFRAVGEGSGKTIDHDEFDVVYHHLFMWDHENNALMGAYRIGLGKQLISGQYLKTLFHFSEELNSILENAIELGRSFIVPEYQKSPLGLMLLWKGVLGVLMKFENYRYLIGPVSISNDYPVLAKCLIKKFVEKYYFNELGASHVKPTFPVQLKIDKINTDLWVVAANGEISILDQIIKDLCPGFAFPVLLKKYLSLNGKILSFNRDPLFSEVIDGLLLLDLKDVPSNMLEKLAGSYTKEEVNKRFFK